MPHLIVVNGTTTRRPEERAKDPACGLPVDVPYYKKRLWKALEQLLRRSPAPRKRRRSAGPALAAPRAHPLRESAPWLERGPDFG